MKKFISTTLLLFMLLACFSITYATTNDQISPLVDACPYTGSSHDYRDGQPYFDDVYKDSHYHTVDGVRLYCEIYDRYKVTERRCPCGKPGISKRQYIGEVHVHP